MLLKLPLEVVWAWCMWTTNNTVTFGFDKSHMVKVADSINGDSRTMSLTFLDCFPPLSATEFELMRTFYIVLNLCYFALIIPPFTQTTSKQSTFVPLTKLQTEDKKIKSL